MTASSIGSRPRWPGKHRRHAAGAFPGTAFLALALAAVPGATGAGPPAGESGGVPPEVAWVRQVGGPAADVPFAVTTHGADGVVTTGTFSATAALDGASPAVELRSAGGSDVFVARHDAAGNLVWVQRLGGPRMDEPRDVAAARDSTVYVAGLFLDHLTAGEGTPAASARGGADAFLAKLSPEGEPLWLAAWGGKYADAATAVAPVADGSVLVGGSFQLTADLDPGEGVAVHTSAGRQDVFLLKLDGGGRLVWARRVGGPHRDEALGVAACPRGDVVLAVSLGGEARWAGGEEVERPLATSGPALALLRLDAEGSLRWWRRMVAPLDASVAVVGCDEAGAVHLAGSFQGELAFEDAEGETVLTAVGGHDLFTAAWGSTGTLLRARRAGGPGVELALAGDLSAGGELVLAGYFHSAADLDPGPREWSLSPYAEGNVDGFVLCLDGGGDARWVWAVGGPGAEQVLGVAGGAGGLYAAGPFQEPLALGAESADALSSRGKTDAFLVRLVAAR